MHVLLLIHVGSPSSEPKIKREEGFGLVFIHCFIVFFPDYKTCILNIKVYASNKNITRKHLGQYPQQNSNQ